jgi:tetratricopeptide (TPR) repeat protein
MVDRWARIPLATRTIWLATFVLFLNFPSYCRPQATINLFQDDQRDHQKPTAAEIKKLSETVAASPASLSAHMDLGIALAETGQWQSALEQFNDAQRLSPDNSEAIYNQGLTYFMLATASGDRNSTAYYQQLDAAQQFLTHALQLNPDLPKIHEHLGRLYHLIGDQDSAREQFRINAKLNPGSSEALNNLGTSLAEIENYSEAIDCYEKALAIDLQCTSCLLNLESAIRRQGSTISARKKYEAMARHDPDSPLAHLLYGMILTVSHDAQDQAVAEIQAALRADSNLAAAHFYLGTLYRQQNKNAAAETEYRIAVRSDPVKVEFLASLAAVLLQENKTKDAEAVLQRALDFDPDNPSLHYKFSQVLQRSGETLKASHERSETARLEKVDQDKSLLEMNLRRGIADLRDGKPSDAVGELKVALALNPNQPETNYYLGIALSQTGDSTGSAQAFRRALERRPEDAEFHYNFGIALWMSGQSSPAIEEFRHTISIRPGDALAHCALGIALLRSGSSEEGTKEISEAQQLGACSQSKR